MNFIFVKSKINSFFSSVKSLFARKTKEKKSQNPLKTLQHSDKNLVFNLSKKSRSGSSIPNVRQLKHLNKVLSQRERSLIKLLSSILVINIIFLLGYSYLQNTSSIPSQGGQYIEALVGHPQFINPVLSLANNVDDDISHLVYSGLLTYNGDYELVTDIASAYEISDDQKEYTFHLKNNVTWHDGEPLTADDILFTIQVIQDPTYNSPLALNFEGVNLEKVDDYTIKFILNEPYTPFLHSLTVGILPAHLWNNVPPSYFKLAEYNIKPVGTGPYKFDSLTKDKLGNIRSMSLVNHDGFYSNQAFIKKITFKFYPDFISAKDALFNKNVQGISKLPRNAYTQAQQSKRYNIYQYPLPQYTALFFNLTKDTTWKSLEMRKALHASLNKQDVVNKVLPEYAQYINGPLLLDASPEENSAYDPNLAIELFEKNGWKHNDEDGLRYKDNKPLSITITSVDQFDNNDVAQYLQTSWKEFGIDVNLEIIPFSDIKEKIKQRSYEVLLYGQLLGNDPDPYPFWHSTQRVAPGLNLSMYANKKADTAIESARKTLDEEKRNEYYKEFEEILLSELPAIFLYRPIYNYAVDTKIKNVNGSQIVYPSDRFNTIRSWYIKTKNSFTKN